MTRIKKEIEPVIGLETAKPEKLTAQDITDILRHRLENPITDRLDLSGKDMSGLNFTTLCRRENKTDFHSAIFRRANLEGANLTGLSLQGCDFTGANLTDAILTDCNTQYAIGL